MLYIYQMCAISSPRTIKGRIQMTGIRVIEYSVKCLSCKHKHLSSIPRTNVEEEPCCPKWTMFVILVGPTQPTCQIPGGLETVSNKQQKDNVYGDGSLEKVLVISIGLEIKSPAPRTHVDVVRLQSQQLGGRDREFPRQAIANYPEKQHTGRVLSS